MNRSNPNPTIVVHGGAWDIPLPAHEDHVAGCRRAAEAGWQVLAAGGPALEAVETAVRILEDDPTYDAGYGSFLNRAGEVELDALLMDGRDLNLGAVAAVRRVRHPITLARLVMAESKYTMLAGPGADEFARAHGVDWCAPWELVMEREQERWRQAQADEDFRSEALFGVEPAPEGHDTVGALAVDAAGNLAAGTSTGGMFNKHPGRVGDSPLVGSGAYADNHSGAASATGMGEHLMRIVISKTACDFIHGGMDAQAAAEAAIQMLGERTVGRGGLIVLDPHGGVGVAHNTPYIAHAARNGEGWIVEGMTHP
jgi:beta-aspartyl-peptidase (threonine type)